MTALLEKIEREAKQLSREDRERLATNLIAGLEQEPLLEIEQAWIDEAERRYDDWKAGRTKAVSAESAVAEMREKLRQ
jgi:putative addiction module component (TIGR02574 family)